METERSKWKNDSFFLPLCGDSFHRTTEANSCVVCVAPKFDLTCNVGSKLYISHDPITFNPLPYAVPGWTVDSITPVYNLLVDDFNNYNLTERTGGVFIPGRGCSYKRQENTELVCVQSFASVDCRKRFNYTINGIQRASYIVLPSVVEGPLVYSTIQQYIDTNIIDVASSNPFSQSILIRITLQLIVIDKNGNTWTFPCNAVYEVNGVDFLAEQPIVLPRTSQANKIFFSEIFTCSNTPETVTLYVAV